MENNPNYHRIKARLGDYEFDAEGDRELVSKQYDQFISTISAIFQAPKPAVQSTAHSSNGYIQAAKPPDNPIEDGILKRVFRQDDGLSLLAMPRTDNAEADALLVILYGFLKLENERAVTGLSLMKAAKQSGINVDRIDRTIDARGGLIQAAGNKRGRRYSLNNRGIAEAERLVREMVE